MRAPTPLPTALKEQRVDAQALAANVSPSARAEQTALFFQEYDARETILASISEIVGADLSNDAIAEAVCQDLAESTVVQDAVIAAFEDDEIRPVRDAIKEEVGDAIAFAFKEDPDVRGEVTSLAKAAVIAAFKGARGASVQDTLREIVRAEIRAALVEHMGAIRAEFQIALCAAFGVAPTTPAVTPAPAAPAPAAIDEEL